MAQESMFWDIVPENVFEVPAENTSADYEREWSVKKDKKEKSDGNCLARFGMESEIAAVKRRRIKGFL